MFRPIIATGVAVAGTAAGDLITNHSIDMQTLGAVAAVVLPATWYLSRRYTKIEDRLHEVESAIVHLKCQSAPVVVVKPKVKIITEDGETECSI